MYSSVLEISKKFNVSKRRVQMLCEQGRLLGAKQISGVWLIPSDIKKPKDERYSKNKYTQLSFFDSEDNNVYTLNDLCKELSISYATGKNWLKLKKIAPDVKGSLYSDSYLRDLKTKIRQNNDVLKHRRNKSQQFSNLLYKDYIGNKKNQNLLESIVSQNNFFSNEEIKIILANVALQMYYKSKDFSVSSWNILFNNYENKITNTYKLLIQDLLSGIDLHTIVSEQLKKVLEYEFEYEKEDDLLGFIYISLTTLNQRKKLGMYYTPKSVVDLAIRNLSIDRFNNIKICDPCCGSGNFLMAFANSQIDSTSLFGQDIDPINIILTRLNMSLFYSNISYDSLCKQFICVNTLLNSFNIKFDIIIGNPPWGSIFTEEEINIYSQLYIGLNRNPEACSLFVEKGLSLLKDNGILCFVLPESILNIGSHYGIRKIISEKCSIISVNFLGNVFYGVQCPSVILNLKLDNRGSMKGCVVSNKNKTFTIFGDRLLNANGFLFNLSDIENDLLEKISNSPNVEFLRNNASFALGIVTGNNKNYITNKKTANNEIVLRGKDISRYKIKQSNNFIDFKPNEFQQVAPTCLYRSKEKLLYRFISNKPIFCYDNKQLLSLNSCNVLIPHIEGLNIKYVLAILNSSVATFFISKRYNSIKILRTYIEQLPIPKATLDEQNVIIGLVDKIMVADNKKIIDTLYAQIDEKIFDLYSLNQQQRNVIRQSI